MVLEAEKSKIKVLEDLMSDEALLLVFRQVPSLFPPMWLSGKEPTCQCKRCKKCRFNPWVGKIPWRRKWQHTPVFFPGESPWTEEPGVLQSRGLQRAGHDWGPTHTASMDFFFFFLAAYRILVPQSKIEPALEVWRLNHWATGEVSLLRIIKLYSDRCCDKSKHKEQRSLKGGTQVSFGDKRGLPRGSNAWEASWNS